MCGSMPKYVHPAIIKAENYNFRHKLYKNLDF